MCLAPGSCWSRTIRGSAPRPSARSRTSITSQSLAERRRSDRTVQGAGVRPRHQRRHHARNDRSRTDPPFEATRAATSPCCSSPAMSARAKATSCAAMSCCASRSRSERSPARSPRPWRATANHRELQLKARRRAPPSAGPRRPGRPRLPRPGGAPSRTAQALRARPSRCRARR